ncbi:hypothetical protein KUTeg_006093 [Tegillarca granosa]|uniref:Uncharacterized protein n=1 Tax=Tegillarca granosa TaxID=220873 RepID=A0ABQ9FFK7_TEGGR|nr:hypothetical protein KUTeg_006093 [Tegillarca granosa]
MLKTCESHGLVNLISPSMRNAIVQIKSLWISFRKDMQLNINGCSIKLEEFMQNNQDDETQKQNLRILQEPENLSRNEKNVKVSVNKLTYQHYKNCRSQFWKDVPHEKAMMVMKKTKKKRLKTIRNLNVKVAKMYQGAGGLQRDYSLIHSRIKEDIECSSIPRKIGEKIYLKNFPHLDGIFDFVHKVKAYPHVITNESTEEDIRLWLEHVVKISDEVLSQWRTLLAYQKNFLELKQDIEVPIGIARKILLSLDHDFLKKWEASEMYSWSFQENQLGDNEECVLVEASIRENFIDALSFYSYEDSQALKKDLDIRNVSGVIYKKLIAKRNSRLETSESHTKPITHADKDPEQTDSKLLENEEKGLTIHHQFLNDGLGLKKAENVKEFTSCKLFIIYSSWTKANDLERLFLFFVLCSEDDFTNKESKTILWNQIRKNVKLWLNTLHKTERCKYTIVENTEDTVTYKGNKLSFSKSNIKTSFFMDKKLRK